MDFSAIMQLQNLWRNFLAQHPKVPAFLAGVQNKGFCAGQEIAIAVRYPDGTEYKTGIRVTADDLAMLNTLRNLAQKAR